MRIPVKIFLVVSILWMAAVSLTAYALLEFSASREMEERASASRHRAFAAERMRSAVTTASFWIDRLRKADDFQTQAQAESAIFFAIRAIEENAAVMQSGLSTTERMAYAIFDQSVRHYAGRAAELVQALRDGRGSWRTSETVDLISDDEMFAMLGNLAAFSRQTTLWADQQTSISQAHQIIARTNLTHTLVVGFGLSLWGAIWFSLGGIVKPIQSVTRSLKKLATGETDVPLHDPNGHSEIDDLWRTAGAFRDTLVRLQAETDVINESRRQLEAILRRDVLTGLGNREQFRLDFQRFADEVEAKPGQRFGLLLLDMDRFKLVNDTLGHGVGDQYLSETAIRIQNAVGPESAVHRLGGDEFAVLIPCREERDILEHGERIARGVGAPMKCGGHELNPAVSIGCAIYPDHAVDVDNLMLFADSCLYRAKASAPKVRMFETGLKAEIEFAQEILTDLGPAIESRQFVVHYQPKVSAYGHGHVGFEALIRWQHPRHGLVRPGRFLPVAEKASLMVEITSCVLEIVARDIADWKAAGLPFGRVAVNVPEDIVGTDFGATFLEQFVRSHGIAWSDLTVEVTEDVFLHRNSDHILRNIQILSERGALISLDDFGTGFASLTHLRQLPMDEVKIDRSFTVDIGRDPRAEEIVRMLLDLSRRLGKATVAEGVETNEQAAFLLAEGCQVLQGFLIAEPMPKTDATAWLRKAMGEGRETGAVVAIGAPSPERPGATHLRDAVCSRN